MFCINCFHTSTAVTNSRTSKKQPSVWRRRRCPRCNTLFTTYERPSLAENKKIQLSDGKDEKFNLGKLTLSIAKAFAHAPKEAQYHSLHLAQTVEDILSSQREVITPEDIAATTHQTLKRYDEMAAIQYAIQHTLITSTRRRGRPSLA
ncbi:NrdR family transcriptional regulator [Streptomyces caniscabiei]|uniref:NrdR family transcriptional regulator n=1 Tax=Streptomyces caniscabiei TaxID=2746961 RepID=UPI0038D47955